MGDIKEMLKEVEAIEREYARTTRWDACSTMGHAGSDGARSDDSDLDRPPVLEDMSPGPEVDEEAPASHVSSAETGAAELDFTRASDTSRRSKKPTSLPPSSRRRDPPPPIKRVGLATLQEFGARLRRGDLPDPVQAELDLRGNLAIGSEHIHIKRNLETAWYSGSSSDSQAKRDTGIRQGRASMPPEVCCDGHASLPRRLDSCMPGGA